MNPAAAILAPVANLSPSYPASLRGLTCQPAVCPARHIPSGSGAAWPGGSDGHYPSWSRRRVRDAVSAVLPAISMALSYAARDF